MSINQNTITFHDGRSAPRIGLGVWQVENDVAATVVQTALDIGYRSIDTAAIYGNEVGVGRGIAQSDRKSVGQGKSGSVRVDLGGRRTNKKKTKNNTKNT